jgi:hypothetical protein
MIIQSKSDASPRFQVHYFSSFPIMKQASEHRFGTLVDEVDNYNRDAKLHISWSKPMVGLGLSSATSPPYNALTQQLSLL